MSTAAIAHGQGPKNRFVKKILRKHDEMMAGNERKHSPMQKHVRFNLGTNTRGKSHPDELASNYNEIKVEKLGDDSTSFV